MHALDNAVWHALTGPHATVAERVPLAARYLPDVSVFSAISDEATPAAWHDLRDLVGPGGTAIFARPELAVPESWTVLFRSPCRQMWMPNSAAADPTRSGSEHPPADLLPLGPGDVPEMLALVEQTRPGPFGTRTIELGSYLGVREGGDLIAMAGERLHPAGFVEISAVCTDPAHQGRGLASQLVRAVVAGIRARGETPFLHLTVANEPAYRVYAALGFETRTFLDVTGTKSPE